MKITYFEEGKVALFVFRLHCLLQFQPPRCDTWSGRDVGRFLSRAPSPYDDKKDPLLTTCRGITHSAVVRRCQDCSE